MVSQGAFSVALSHASTNRAITCTNSCSEKLQVQCSNSNTNCLSAATIDVPASASNLPLQYQPLDPNAPSYQPDDPHINLRRHGARNSQSRTPQFSPEKAEIESLKIELSYAKTKILELETKNSDKQRSLLIYKEKVRLLESQMNYSSKDAALPSSTKNTETTTTFEADFCSCKVRSKILENASKILDLDQRLIALNLRIPCTEALFSSSTHSPVVSDNDVLPPQVQTEPPHYPDLPPSPLPKEPLEDDAMSDESEDSDFDFHDVPETFEDPKNTLN